MALTNESNKQVFLPQAGQTSFQFTLKYFNDTDIKVEIKLANGNIVPTSDFSFTVNAINNNRDLGADVDITISPDLAAGDTVTIFREVPFTQEYDLQAGSTINPTALNDAFDRIVAQNQQQNLNTQRTITFPVSDPSTTTYNVDTSTTNRANRALGFDSNGNITELNLTSTNTVAGNNNKGINLTDGVIEAKVDFVTTEFDNNGNIRVKDSSISTNKLATGAVTTAKIADLTGTDTNVVTGTKGANGQLVGWDANGDAVDSGFNVTNNDNLGISDTTIPTQGNVKAYVDTQIPTQMIGVGQTWQLVSRSLDGTEYTNSTGKPIMLNVRTHGNTDNHAVNIHIKPIGGSFVEFTLINASNSGGGVHGNGSTIIPNNSVYKLTKTGDAITSTQYAELR